MAAWGMTAWLDLLWPRACEVCGRPAGDTARYLCWDCLAALPLIEGPYCARCGDPADGVDAGEYLCAFCVDRLPAYDRARSAVRFRGGIREVLHRYKYSNGIHLGPDLAAILAACVRTHYAHEPIDAVAFVPLHAARERERSYNQSRLLAASLARQLGLPLARGLLERVRPTVTQTRFNLRERARNMRDAFAVTCPAWIAGRSVLLVDDVMTTGATVNEVARALKRAGSGPIFVATVARG